MNREIVVITGMSGAGRSTVAHAMEDPNFSTISIAHSRSLRNGVFLGRSSLLTLPMMFSLGALNHPVAPTRSREMTESLMALIASERSYESYVLELTWLLTLHNSMFTN